MIGLRAHRLALKRWTTLPGAIVCAALLTNTLGVSAALAEPVPSSSNARIRIDVQQFGPRVVNGSTHQLTLDATVTNIGDRGLSDLTARAQFAAAAGSAEQVRESMDTPPLTSNQAGAFRAVVDHLDPGQSAPLHLDESLVSGPLQLSQPGVYPLSINVNGMPDYGGQARLGSLDMLLPVSTAPGRRPADDTRRSPLDLTLLWPIAALAPSRVGNMPDGKTVLSDDSLAVSMDQGRLHDLVTTADSALSSDPQLKAATCFAVDPDIVHTALSMSGGYYYLDGDERKPGSGAASATRWLDDLRKATSGRCVVPTTYADADLVALSRSGAVDLEKQALNSSVLNEQLNNAKILDSVVLPTAHMLDERTVNDLAPLLKSSVTAVLDPANLGNVTDAKPHPLVAAPATNVRAVTLDPLVNSGFSGRSQPVDNSTISAQTPASTPALASQNGIASLLYRAQFDQQAPTSLFAVPPMRWNTSAADLDAMLDALRSLLANGSARPQSLPARLSAAAGVPAHLRYPPSAAASEIPAQVTSQLVDYDNKARDVFSAMQTDPSKNVRPAELTARLQQQMLRAVSGVWRGNEQTAIAAADSAGRSLRDFTGQVRVQSSQLPTNLASEDSKLPVSVRNEFPVAVTVRLKVDAAGLRTETPYIERLVPARASRTFTLPVSVLRSGRFNVDIHLSTAGGTQFGNPVRLDVVSSAYGPVTLAVTGTAFAALILLSGRRIYRRVRTGKTTEVQEQ